MILSKVISTLQEKGRLIVKILGAGSSDIKTVFNLTPFGLDSNITKNYRAIYADTAIDGEKVLIGVILKNAIADVGETRIFSENSEGNEAFTIHLKNDGSCELGGDTDNMVRYSILKEEYDKTKAVLDAILNILNGAPVNEPGNGSPSALQIALSTALSGLSTGDIEGSRINEVKTL